MASKPLSARGFLCLVSILVIFLILLASLHSYYPQTLTTIVEGSNSENNKNDFKNGKLGEKEDHLNHKKRKTKRNKAAAAGIEEIKTIPVQEISPHRFIAENIYYEEYISAPSQFFTLQSPEDDDDEENSSPLFSGKRSKKSEVKRKRQREEGKGTSRKAEEVENPQHFHRHQTIAIKRDAPLCNFTTSWCPTGSYLHFTSRGSKRNFPISESQMSTVFPTIPLAIVVPLGTCPSNLWHGLVEFLFPILHTICHEVPEFLRSYRRPGGSGDSDSQDEERESAQLALLLRHMCSLDHRLDEQKFGALLSTRVMFIFTQPFEGDKFWGAENKGCPFVKHPNAGIFNGPATPLLGPFLTPRNTIFLPQARGDQRFHFRWMIFGVPRKCSLFPPFPNQYPFFATGSNNSHLSKHREDCFAIQKLVQWHLRKEFKLPNPEEAVTMAQKNGAASTRSAAPSPIFASSSSSSCFTILLILRHNNQNGRFLRNRKELMSKLTSFVAQWNQQHRGGKHSHEEIAELCPLVTDFLQPRPFTEQVKLVASADIVIAARGAASIFTLMMKPGAGYISLFPVKKEERVSVENDNFPWWPFPFTMEGHQHHHSLYARFVPCEAETNLQHYKSKRSFENCRQRSVNYCDMRCDEQQIQNRVHELILASSFSSLRKNLNNSSFFIFPKISRRGRYLSMDNNSV